VILQTTGVLSPSIDRKCPKLWDPGSYTLASVFVVRLTGGVVERLRDTEQQVPMSRAALMLNCLEVAKIQPQQFTCWHYVIKNKKFWEELIAYSPFITI
jgi:hypothetical protein